MKSKNNTSIAIVIAAITLLLVSAVTIVIYSPSPMIVLSGSMEPVMSPGDIVIITPITPSGIKISDIITFKLGGNVIVTHRVISITNDSSGLLFHTKGDANEDADNFITPASSIIGKAVFIIPYLGYLPEITKNPKIFVILILIPSLLIIIDELLNIIKYSNPLKLRKMERDEKKAKTRIIPREVNWTPLIIITIIIILLSTIVALPYIFSSQQVEPTIAYSVENNGLFTASYTILPNPVHGLISPGNATSVTINEASTISICPLIVPVFWVSLMADIHPIIPCLFFIKIITIFVIIITLPVWYKKPKIFSRKKV